MRTFESSARDAGRVIIIKKKEEERVNSEIREFGR